jgi:hypothetical protein
MKDIHYSPREKALLAAMRGAGRRLTSTELIDKVFGEEAPFNARQSLMNTMTSLSRKIEGRKERFALKKTARRGPRPVSFWLEERA